MLDHKLHTILAGLPFLRGVSLATFDRLIPEDVRLISRRDGDIIIREGDPADHVYFLTHDEVEVTREGKTMRIASAPDLLGEQACLEADVPRSATLVARRAPQLVQVSCRSFEILLEDQAFARNVILLLSGKLRRATADRAYRYGREERLFGEFRAHVSQEALDELLSSDGDAYGQPRVLNNAVVLFSDVRNFTNLSATMDPVRMAREVGDYLSATVDVIHKFGGYVDKFIGDAVMAFWGLLPTRGSATDLALNCAREMVEAVARCSFAGAPISIGVGIEAGDIFCGNIGSAEKRQFTVLGPAVNAAARFEPLSKELHSPIVVGPGAYQRLSPAEATRLTPRTLCVRSLGTITCYVTDEGEPSP